MQNKNKKSISSSIKHFEKTISNLKKKNLNYKVPDIYDWGKIKNKYENLFFKIVKTQSR